MAIILFLMDTSGSMNQRTCLGPTYLDYGKIAIESFLKIRAKDHANWKDRFMLVSCEDFPAAIKVGWRDVSRDVSHTVYFREELNKIVATSMTNLGGAIKCSLDLLNIHRVQNGLDNYGQGRNPFLMEPAVVVIISDGCRLTNTQTVTEALTLPMHPSFPGSELTKDPFRWDQRIFSIVLRFKGNVDNDFVETVPYDAQINAMCEVTGGRSYAVSTQKSLCQALESINQKVMSGVVLQFERLPSVGDPPISNELWYSTRRMIFVNKSSNTQLAHWPIPEGFWPTRDVRPIRTAIPLIYFSSENKRVNVLDNLPFDKYELEPSPLTQYILELRQPNVCWQTFVKNSSREKGIKGTFGYLKASVKGTCVNMFVMPYNYPVLFPLLEELIKEFRMQPNNAWITEFKSYVSSIPLYYYGPLRVALRRLGIPSSLLVLIPEGGDTLYFTNYLKSLKQQAKTEATRYMDEVKSKEVEVKLDVPRKHVSTRDIINSNLLKKKMAEDNEEITKNPFHTTHDQILSQLTLLRKEIGLTRALNTTTSIADERARFNVAQSKMGLGYQDAFARSLRVVDVNQRANHMFGNPFKLGSSKKQISNMMFTDEIDSMNNMQQKPINRRKQLPLKAYPAPSPPDIMPPARDALVTPPTPLLSAVTPPPNPPAGPGSPPAWISAPNLHGTFYGNDFPKMDFLSNKADVKPKPPSLPTPNQSSVSVSRDPGLPVRSPPASPLSLTPKLANSPTPWVFTPTDPDIAAAIGSGNEDKGPVVPIVKKTKPNNIVKENVVSINPAMKESFLKFSDTESFMDKNRIKDNFGGETNGVNRTEGRQEADHKSKRSKLSGTSHGDTKRDNKKLKDMIYKELRKPGKNYEQLFGYLNQVKGSTEVKRNFAEDVIGDAQKFKKKLLIERLKNWQKEVANR